MAEPVNWRESGMTDGRMGVSSPSSKILRISEENILSRLMWNKIQTFFDLAVDKYVVNISSLYIYSGHAERF